MKKKKNLDFFLEKMCGCACACGCQNWVAGACAAHYENVCDVRAGSDENLGTLKVCSNGNIHKEVDMEKKRGFTMIS